MVLLIVCVISLILGFKLGIGYYYLREYRNANFTTKIVSKIMDDENIKLNKYIDKNEELNALKNDCKELLKNNEKLKLKIDMLGDD